ncbi:MAG: sugar ABC transporter permease, partial [Streptococcus salivarius]|nr:sugar ABC transporter permease [Streptococcus salivarius]
MSQTIYDTTPMRQVFKEGTWDVKLSFLVMGLANLVNKQFTKGLLFLLSEIAFLVAFVIQIIPALKGMITLGTQEQGEAIKEVNGVKLTVQVAGDNSMLLLIFGLASLIFCAVFAYI